MSLQPRPPTEQMSKSHGRRSTDISRMIVSNLDAPQVNLEVSPIRGAACDLFEINQTGIAVMRTHSSRPTRLKYWLFNSLPIAIACWTFGSFLLYFTYVAGVGLSSLPTEDASCGRFSAELEATRLAKQKIILIQQAAQEPPDCPGGWLARHRQTGCSSRRAPRAARPAARTGAAACAAGTH